MAETIGVRLRNARRAKGQSIEDVSHATRIHANYIRGLEHDDYSGFASTTYAKSFRRSTVAINVDG
ncbi:MAG: helix-turn-helix domain-containing protein [Akkermansiaceae bacterium]|nr:helix-turn-helix domain-containing protein [Akkermansiaceae bacterium]